MKKLICYILMLSALLCLTGCNREKTELESPITAYYRRADVTFGTASGVIATTYFEGAGHEKDYSHLLQSYFSATPPHTLASTFPQGLTLVSFKLDALTAKIIVSDHLSTFTGMDLTIACVCLTQTVMSMTGCREVIISAETAQLGGQNFITLSQDSYLLLDESHITP